MPGSSLWLTPPPTHPLHDVLTALIETKLPALFQSSSPPPPVFVPHLTLTSEIPPAAYGDAPQDWLDAIPWPRAADVAVRFGAVRSQDVFFRRCYLSAGFAGVRDIAALARARGVNGEEEVDADADADADGRGARTVEEWLAWWKEAFGPHVSLMYHDITIDEAKLQEIVQAVKEAGIRLEDDEPTASSGGSRSDGLDGWQGGIVWLVPTDKPIDEWKPIAKYELR